MNILSHLRHPRRYEAEMLEHFVAVVRSGIYSRRFRNDRKMNGGAV